MAELKVPVTGNDHVQGPETAPVTLVEYGDYECPHCGRAHPIVKRVQKHYRDQLRFVFRNFPLTQIHPMAEPAAEAAEFAGARGKFWEMHDAIYENQPQLSLELLTELAADLDLPEDELLEALEKHLFLEKVRSDFAGGVRSGVNGTPTFFINGHRHEGSWDYQDLVAAIDSVLARGKRPAA
jgi:protein-disulfide isomerase